jgi:hypothetical protein
MSSSNPLVPPVGCVKACLLSSTRFKRLPFGFWHKMGDGTKVTGAANTSDKSATGYWVTPLMQLPSGGALFSRHEAGYHTYLVAVGSTGCHW